MSNKQITKLSQTLLSGLLTAGILMSANTAQAAVSQIPLNLAEGVSPNVILTLDESGSMSWGHIPDRGSAVYDTKIGDYDTKRYRANNTNPMYYSPHIIYEIPPAFKLNGEEYKLTTSFNNAPVNGFDPNGSRGKIDLSNNYRVIIEHRIPSGTYNEANNPRADFSCSVNIGSNNRSESCTMLGGSFTIKRTGRNSCTVTHVPTLSVAGKSYKPPVVYCNGSSGEYTASMLSRSMPAYYYEFDSKMDDGNCAGKKNDSDAGGEVCYRLRWVGEDSAYDKNNAPLYHPDGTPVNGEQNFAIWYSFYRSRALATLSAASIAFYDLSSNIRFTWQNLDTCKSFTGTTSGSGNCYANSLKPFNARHRGEFYSWLRSVYFNKSTPLRNSLKRAGEYLKTDTPWKMNPQGGSIGGDKSENTKENTLACRPSYHVLMTDGMWNSSVSAPSNFRQDSSSFDTPGGTRFPKVRYSNVKPFYDSQTYTLADLAMHYWATDLRTDLENKVPTFMPFKNNDPVKEYWDPRNNPAEWQHMTNFVMGLGLTTSLDNDKIPWSGSTHAGPGYAALVDGSATWPAASSGSKNNVYDLWHTAINSRGEFYSVDSPEDMVKAFKDILNRIAERQSSAALPAISSSVESDETDPDSIAKLASYFYRSSFDSTDWSGDLEKIKSYVTYTDGVRSEEAESVWKASSKLPEPSRRGIYIAGSDSNKLQPFTTTNVNSITALKDALNREPDKGTVDGMWRERLHFIRGDKSNEGSLFRERETVIGEFLNSRPVLVSGARYLEGFANKVEGENHTKYSSFVDTQKKRRAQVYIGGNDGMLHAFDAASGEEKFAFIPTAVFPHLNRLTDPKYSESHHFYVDGTPEVADVYDGTNWRTILVGTLRAGGKGIFALDVTDPDNIKLLWELDENSAEFKNKVKPGYSFPKPTIARLHNGRWAVVTGNGIENGDDSGKAALYIIDAITGELTKSLEVKSDKAINNGLSTPKLVDFDADGIADYAYAGDMHGNLWRFDLLGNSASQARENGSIYGDRDDGVDKFRVSYGSKDGKDGKDGKPMFTAVSSEGRPQMITAPPSIVRHPDRASYLVVFGTGKYYEEGDKGGDLSSAQTLYAIWDEKTMAQPTESALSISRSNLVGQSFIEEVAGENAVAGVTRQGRTLTNNLVSWEDNKGWFLDLKVGSKLTGEMLIDDMLVVGRTLLFSTLVPNDDPCAHGAGNWLYAINPFTGGRTERHVFDTRGPNAMVLSGIKFGDPGGVPLTLTSGGLEVPSSSGYEGINIAEMTGRQTWRVVPDP